MDEPLVRVDDRDHVRIITLNRADRHNAFDDALIAQLSQRLSAAGEDEDVRVVVLTGAGTSFSAGADIAWMRRAGEYDELRNISDAAALAVLMATLDQLPKPVVARVNGAAIGGGLGLVACADIAIAADNAVFATSEVRLGIVPAVIGPFVVRAIGPRQARRLFLTAERIDADHARRLGLVHEVVPAGELDARVDATVEALLQGGPQALADAKLLVDEVAGAPIDDDVMALMAQRIASIRSRDEAKEGLAAFLAKRRATWAG